MITYAQIPLPFFWKPSHVIFLVKKKSKTAIRLLRTSGPPQSQSEEIRYQHVHLHFSDWINTFFNTNEITDSEIIFLDILPFFGQNEFFDFFCGHNKLQTCTLPWNLIFSQVFSFGMPIFVLPIIFLNLWVIFSKFSIFLFFDTFHVTLFFGRNVLEIFLAIFIISMASSGQM